MFEKKIRDNGMNKEGQIWIETVLYTLIGLSLIGLTLTFVMPRINASKDIATIEQTMESLNVFQKYGNLHRYPRGNEQNTKPQARG